MDEKEARKGLSVVHKIESVKEIFDKISLEDISGIRKILSQYIPVREVSTENNPRS